MRDPRSSADAHVWVGADGRVHRESQRPPLSVFGVLDCWYWDVTEARGFDSRQQTTVAGLCTWLGDQVGWLTSQECVVEFHEDVALLVGQLKPLTGGGQKPVAICPRVVDGRPCRSKLFEPDRDGVITCPRCHWDWPREKWRELGEAS
jgi:hypothetical protein